MIDLKKPRLTENNKYTGEADCATPCCDIHKDCALGKNAEKGGCFYELVSRLNELENAIESGELVPVVHGEWIEDEDEDGLEADCSLCDSREVANLLAHHFGKYCPNCGAKMDGKDGE